MGMLVHGSDVKKPFGAAVRIWRHKLAISQEELAGRAGLHRTYVCDVERGARNVSLESIEKIARALEISTATLFTYEPPPEGTNPIMAEGLVDILFVEDDPLDAKLTMTGLKGITNRVQWVHDGESALDFLFCRGEFARRQRSHRPQLVLLDLGLPKMGGLEVLHSVKSDPRTETIPVVVLTGSESERDVITSRRLGAAAYILKPVDLVNLNRVVPTLHFQWALLKPPPEPRS